MRGMLRGPRRHMRREYGDGGATFSGRVGRSLKWRGARGAAHEASHSGDRTHVEGGAACPSIPGLMKTVATPGAHCPSSWSEVQSVRLSRRSCMMSVESLYESSATLSSSAVASSNAVRAILQASSGLLSTSYWNTE